MNCPQLGLCVWLSGALAILSLSSLLSTSLRADEGDPASTFEVLEWREIGPYRGGRSAAVCGVPSQANVYYFGATGGGVWKTSNGGTSWKNVSDGFFGGSIGAVTVSEWDPNVVYVGGGEKTIRGNVSHGDGMWRSTDAGKTWTGLGLSDTRHIPRIRVHPKDPDLVYVAALGHLYGPNDERGIYRSSDGGEHWENILFVNENAGAVDLVMDPSNPRILYASFWRVQRTPWGLESGGEGSGLWKTTDGGDNWIELTTNEGLPEGTIGISGIAVSATNSENVYAIIEAEEGGVFRSRDGGETWNRTNDERDKRQRAWYYTRIYADTRDEDTVYVLNVRFHRSKDGGKTFEQISVPHGDNHDLWIAPDDPQRMVQANDGGANVSFDGGQTWSLQNNQPTAQMYRVSVDNAFPYRLLGGQQDNSAIRIRSRSAFGSAIGTRDWEPTAGGESGHIVAKPDDPDVVYGGSYGGLLTRIDHRTGERRAVNVWPDDPMGWGAANLKHRFQWNFPIFFSPHDSGTLYAASNVLSRSRDEGASWEAISPDLTRDDKTKMESSGGPITKDNTSVEYYGTIFAALESKHEPGVLWTGSDDGLIHISRDNGQTWSQVTPTQLPEWTMINSIEEHPFQKGGLYVAGTRYKLDDFAPYLYRTLNYGKSWTRIDSGIDPLHFTRVIRADPDRPGLLYAGTERGVYASFDDGEHWESLQLELPVVPVTDLAVKEGDLVAATQGRGFWILDDLSLLHQYDADRPHKTAHLYTPRATHRLAGGRRDEPINMGTNPPSGVVLYYSLEEAPGDELELQLDILDASGTLIRHFTRKPDKEPEEDAEERDEPDDPRQLEAEAGMNRFIWDLRYPSASRFKGMVLWNRGLRGPRAVPGHYTARLTLGEWSHEVSFELLADPRSSTSAEDYSAQFDFLISVRDKLNQTHEAIDNIRTIKGQLVALKNRLEKREGSEDLIDAAKHLEWSLGEVEEALYQTKMQSPQDPLNYPIRINDKLAGLLGAAGIGDNRPTSQAYAVRGELFAAIDAELDMLLAILEVEFLAFNELAREHEVPALTAD